MRLQRTLDGFGFQAKRYQPDGNRVVWVSPFNFEKRFRQIGSSCVRQAIWRGNERERGNKRIPLGLRSDLLEVFRAMSLDDDDFLRGLVSECNVDSLIVAPIGRRRLERVVFIEGEEVDGEPAAKARWREILPLAASSSMDFRISSSSAANARTSRYFQDTLK